MTINETRFSHVEVSGDTVTSVIKAISAHALCRTFLDKHGFKDVEKGHFYPMNNYLSLIQEIEKRMPTVLKKVGQLICKEAILSPHIKNFEQLMMGMDAGYLRNHRGYQEDEIGHFYCDVKSQKEFSISSNTPYPCIFDQGIILGFAKKFDVSISIDHTGDNCRSKGEPQCNYHVLINV